MLYYETILVSPSSFAGAYRLFASGCLGGCFLSCQFASSLKPIIAKAVTACRGLFWLWLFLWKEPVECDAEGRGL
jgi:hypothetical protein